MCAIIGALAIQGIGYFERFNSILEEIWLKSHERGRDGRGYVSLWVDGKATTHKSVARLADPVDVTPSISHTENTDSIIGNMRAEPTTEHVQSKHESDQQPYSAGGWHIVHNGTIANDKELRTNSLMTTIDSAAIVEQLEAVAAQSTASHEDIFLQVVRSLKGSYAILAVHEGQPDVILAACNYRPLWVALDVSGLFLASARQYFPEGLKPIMIQPYSAWKFTSTHSENIGQLYPMRPLPGKRALVVCSGGLDSVVAATYVQRRLGMQIHLIHFLYGSRAEGPEVQAVKRVAEELNCELTLFPLNVYSKGDSKLLDSDATVAGGEAGAEFAHEWVPARNLLLLSVATAFAEARGIDTIVLGNNLEEAGAYPDNEPEFIARFNDMLPFAVGDGKRMRVIMPVGNLMKHEIVALGHGIGAPMNLTWSCYRAGSLHCGTCGPCYMRRKAFEINNLPEVISYKDEVQ